MALPPQIQDREFQKFEDVEPGKTAVRVTAQNFSGNFAPSGLRNAGRVTIVTINSATWTELPPTALTDRNAIAIQNLSGQEIKINFDDSVAGYVGIVVSDGSERAYDITDDIKIYAKSNSGTAVLNIEEIS